LYVYFDGRELFFDDRCGIVFFDLTISGIVFFDKE